MHSVPISTRQLSRSIATAALLLLSTLLAACAQNETSAPTDRKDSKVTMAVIASEVQSVVLVVTDSAGAVTSHPATIDPATRIASVTVEDVPFGTTTFAARGFDADDVALYSGSTTVEVTAESGPVSVNMSRLTGRLDTTATSVEAMDSEEVVIATIGGVRQRLVLQDANVATGTLSGIATGSGRTISVQSHLNGTPVRTGSNGDVTVTETGGSVTVTLNPVATDMQPPVVTELTVPGEVVQGVEFSLTVNATDADGDLETVTVDWGDGSPADTADVSTGSAVLTHTYSVPGVHTISATATDAAGHVSLAETMLVDVTPADADSDVPVEIDVDQEVSLVTLTATGVPAGTTRVQAVVTDAATTSFAVELIPEGGDWTAAFQLLQDADYTVVLLLNPGPGQVEGEAQAFSIADEPESSVTVEYAAPTTEPTEPTLVLTTTCSETTPLDAGCEVSIAIAGFSGSFDSFDFSFSFQNDAFVAEASGVGALTGGWTILNGPAAAGGFSLVPASGSGEVMVLNVTRQGAGPDRIDVTGSVTMTGEGTTDLAAGGTALSE